MSQLSALTYLEENHDRFQNELIELLLEPTDQIVLVAVARAHRADAFEACEFIMDYLKTQAPFWKKEAAGWVEARAADDKAAERWK